MTCRDNNERAIAVTSTHHATSEASFTEGDRQKKASAIGSRRTSQTDKMGNSRSPSRRTSRRTGMKTAVVSLLSASSVAMAQNCISLQDSTTCPAFSSSRISTNDTLVGFFPFLQYVSDTASFDQQLRQYVETSYVQEKYQALLGCGKVDLKNTTELYARFTTTVICNSIVQNSITLCGLSSDESRPVCAETCAQYAESEAYVAADSSLCSNPGSGAAKQIRADFTNCALPANSLSQGNCVQGIANEPANCGYGNSTIGLCSYCSSGGINSTDTCCYNSDVQTRCAGVVLPSITPTLTFPTTTATTTPNATTSAAAAGGKSKSGLSGGAIAGIVIGSVAGVALLALLAFLCLYCLRRRRGSQKGSSIFNQPSPARRPAMSQSGQPSPPYEVLPGGRIARMSALEGHTTDVPSRHGTGSRAAAAAAGAAGYAVGKRRGDNHSSSDEYVADSPGSDHRPAILRPPPTTLKRNASLSSGSVLLAGEDPSSPISGGMSSPQGMASQQSEQLPFFKDYYSQDDIHPGDRVSVLWAYQPRAADEFTLERGDMLKVVGIWDDGWATGVMLDERADEWEARRQAQRDSGVSNTSGRARDSSPPVSGEIKAFPLVCVCLPDHWRKTIEGDGSTETGSSSHHALHGPP